MGILWVCITFRQKNQRITRLFSATGQVKLLDLDKPNSMSRRKSADGKQIQGMTPKSERAVWVKG